MTLVTRKSCGRISAYNDSYNDNYQREAVTVNAARSDGIFSRAFSFIASLSLEMHRIAP
jgi:hypothetical protein